MQLPPDVTALLWHACRLQQALYGLKQAPHIWYERSRQSLLSAGYTQSLGDYAVFRRSTHGLAIMI